MSSHRRGISSRLYVTYDVGEVSVPQFASKLSSLKCIGELPTFFGRHSTLYSLFSPKSFHHHFFAPTIASGGPPGGLPAASADPRHTPALAARLAQARKKIGAPSLACGAHLLRKEEHSFIHHSLARFVHHYHSYFGGSKNEDLMVIRARRAESSRTRE